MSFLDSDHTIANYRNFFWNPEFLYKDNFQKWIINGSQGIIDRARLTVEEILNSYKPKQLPVAVVKEIDRIAGLD